MTDTRLKIIFGFFVLFIQGFLAGVIAVCKVEEKYSFGLPFILGGLTGLSGAFGAWAFNITWTKNIPPEGT